MNFKSWLMEGLKGVKIPLPSVRQSHDFDCGAAALRSVCEFFKVGPEDHTEFIAACKSGDHGTNTKDMIRAAKSFGLQTKVVDGMSLEQLKSFMDKGCPVIICMQAWEEDGDKKAKKYNELKSGHYVVVIGYDEKSVFFEDPMMSGKRGVLPFDEFISRWHDKGTDREYHQYGIAMWKPVHRPEVQHVHGKKKLP